MFRMLALWGVALAALCNAGSSSAGTEPEDVLTGKELFASGSMYILRAEDEVKKAALTSETRLKEYRRAVAWEKNATRTEAEKKAMAADLTKQRAALKQQMDQAQPQLKAQIQGLQQQQAALRQQMNGMGGGRNRYAGMARNQLANESNGLGQQISMIQAESNQMTATYNAMGIQIEQLAPKPGSAVAKTQEAEKGPTVSPEAKRQAYVDALATERKLVDETKTTYATLADDAEVKAALEALDKKSAKVKHTLGPSKKFLDTVKALEEAEAKVASNTIIEELKPAASPKRKSRTASRK